MKFNDMDMLQDYEKDTRMAVIAFSLIETEIMDTALRAVIHKGAEGASKSQKKASDLILSKGDRP